MANTRMIETLANTSEGLEGGRKQGGQLSEDVDQLGSEAAPTVKDGVCVTVCLEMGGGGVETVYTCVCMCVCVCAVVSSGPRHRPVLTKGN